MDWAALAQLAGSVASQYGKQQQGRAAGAATQADLTQRQDQNALARYIAQQNAQNTAASTDLARKQYTDQSRGSTAKQALTAALLGHFTPTGNLSGGLAKGLSSPDAKTSLGELSRQALLQQFEPTPFQGGQVLTPPALTGLPNVGGNSVLNTLASVGQLAGSASPYIQQLLKKDPTGAYADLGQGD
jgi:hypothetical protein